MNQGIIRKEKLGPFLDSVRSEYRFFGPQKNGNVISMVEQEAGEGVDLDYVLLRLSAKDKFFPQTEIISGTDEEEAHHQKTVIFGTRPCDAHALLIVDKLFLSETEDPFYLSKRKSTLIISRACSAALDTCFCTSMGGGPCSSLGSDILVHEVGDSYLFEGVSDTGLAFLDGFADAFSEPTQEHREARDLAAAEIERKMPRIPTDGISEKLGRIAESGFWDTIHQSCLSCGVCTYLCPTCHCFAFHDEQTEDTHRRVRSWDTCQYPLFTQEASGHNPRPTTKKKIRQRMMHKFNYFVTNSGAIACVGCGRCVTYCPVNIDIREILTSAFEVKE